MFGLFALTILSVLGASIGVVLFFVCFSLVATVMLHFPLSRFVTKPRMLRFDGDTAFVFVESFFYSIFRSLKKVSHVAHRGGIDVHLENSLSAFRWAARLEHVNVLELDVRLTKDRKVIISHDDGLHRLLNRSDVYISETNYDDLPVSKLIVVFCFYF
jgi:hypothetical protein